MSYVEYEKAQKAGLKAFKTAVSKGEDAYLPVLDEILKDVDIVGEVSLGLVQIPLENVVGTSNAGRTYAFANNFMPILDYKTEFGVKWSTLCDSQIEEGIREPIKVYEYLNKFYVIEGNKRVSVLKYFGAVNVSATVMRKIPKLTDDLETRIYYEFMDFYKLTDINYIWFSQEGFFKRLLELTSENPEEPWTDDQKNEFYAILGAADSVEYTSQHLFRGCMGVRNAKLVEHATSHCICYHDPSRKSGTSQTIGFAKEKGLKVINLFK